MSSDKDKDSEFSHDCDIPEAYQYEKFNIKQDYIPHPNSIIANKLAEISSQVNGKLQNVKFPQRGPYLSKIFGDIRKEAFAKFEAIINEYPEPKRSDYLREFYYKIDIESQKNFDTTVDLKDMYRQIIQEKDFSSNSPTVEDNDQAEVNKKEMSHEYAVKLLNKSVLGLTADWYLTLEKIVDLLIKSQLYRVKKCSIYK